VVKGIRPKRKVNADFTDVDCGHLHGLDVAVGGEPTGSDDASIRRVRRQASKHGSVVKLL